jgi:hypothetical protein
MSAPGVEIEGVPPAAALPSRGPKRQVAGALERLREQATTTPGRLVVLSVAVLLGAAAFGVLATIAERSRATATHAVQTETEPALVQAGDLYVSLTDANATVTMTLLRGGAETSVARARYARDIARATAALGTLTRDAGSSASLSHPLGVIAAQLPVYTGLVGNAQANNRLGYPLGAAYLRQGAALLNTTVLPAADSVYATEARRLNDDYATGTSTSTLAIFIALVVIGLVLLVVAQVYMAFSSHRILSLPMVAATVVLTGVSIWGVAALTSEQNALGSARSDGSDPVVALTAARVLLARAQSDVSLTLVNRGSDEANPLDFAAVMGALAPAGGAPGLVHQVVLVAGRHGSTTAARRFVTEFNTYRAETTHLSALENSGQITSALSSAPAAAQTAEQMSATLQSQTSAAQARFERDAAQGTSALGGLGLGLPLLTALAAVLALLGLRQRINEYR